MKHKIVINFIIPGYELPIKYFKPLNSFYQETYNLSQKKNILQSQ